MGVPFVLAPDLQRGTPERLSPVITRVIADNPGPFTYTGSGTYLLDAGGETVVIDPGPDDPRHVERVAACAPSRISTILVTHTHRDHSGGTDRLKSLTGARTFGFGPHPSPAGAAAPALDEGADHGFKPDVQLADGEVLSYRTLTITAVHTPGHISNHLCFAVAEERALFTGDHIMGWATTVVAPPDGDMQDYLRSLDLLLARSDRVYYPTHGAPILEPETFVRAVKEHRQSRDRAVLEELSKGPRTITEIVEAVYPGLAPALRVAAGLNVRAHLEMHERLGRVEREGERFALVGR